MQHKPKLFIFDEPSSGLDPLMQNTFFEPYRKRLSDAPVFWPAACAYDGKLFAIGRSMTEPGFALFRATPVETFETFVPPPEEPEEEEVSEEDAAAGLSALFG